MVFCNQDYYTWFPHDKISMCHHHLENYLEALKEHINLIKGFLNIIKSKQFEKEGGEITFEI